MGGGGGIVGKLQKAADPGNVLGIRKTGGAAPGAVGMSPEASKKARKKDFAEGLAQGKEIIGDKSLGRIQDQPGIAQAMEMQRARLGGLTGAEMQAQRDVAGKGIDRATQLASRQLAGAQARAGVRGATAGQQQMQTLRSGTEQKANLERQLLMGQRAAQGEAISDVLGQGAATQKFDLSQAAKEKFAQLNTAMGMQQLGVSERAGVAAQNASLQSAAMMKPQGGLLGKG